MARGIPAARGEQMAHTCTIAWFRQLQIRFAIIDVCVHGGENVRHVIFAINTTLDGCVDHTKQIVDDEKLEYFTHLMRDVDLTVYGRKTYRWFLIGLKSRKTSPTRKQTLNLLEYLTPSTKLFFHGRWTALKIEIRELFVRTCATKSSN